MDEPGGGWSAPSLDDVFEDYLAGVQAEERPVDPGGGLEELTDVHRMLSRVARLDAGISELTSFVARRKAELDKFLGDSTAGMREQRAEILRAIKSYARAHPRRATLILPSGRVASRPPRDRIVVVDAEAAKDWAETSDRLHLLKITVEPRRDELTKLGRSKPIVDPEVVRPAVDSYLEDWAKTHKDLPDDVPPSEFAVTQLVDETGEIVPGVFAVQPTRRSVSVTPNVPEPRREP